jgi:hypothetical protein
VEVSVGVGGEGGGGAVQLQGSCWGEEVEKVNSASLPLPGGGDSWGDSWFVGLVDPVSVASTMLTEGLSVEFVK